MKTEHLHIRISPEDMKRLKSLSTSAGKSKSKYLLDLIPPLHG